MWWSPSACPTYQLQRGQHKGQTGDIQTRCAKESKFLILLAVFLSLKPFEFSLLDFKTTVSLSNLKNKMACFLLPLAFPSVSEI